MKQYLKSNRVGLFILVLILLSTDLVYWKTLGYGFYFDDYAHIKSLTNLSNGLKSNRPLGFVLWFTIASIWGLHPAPLHAAGIILHLSCGLAFFYMLRTIQKHTRINTENGSSITPIIMTAIFLLHPVQTESVVYLFQANSVLPMALSCFLAVTCYIKYRACERKFYLLAIFFLTFLASTSRESAIVLPVCLWLVEWILVTGGRLRESFQKWPIFLGCLVLSATIISISASFVSYADAQMGFGYKGITPFSYLITQFVVIIKYIRLIFLPIGQNLDYDLPIYTTIFALKPVLSFMVLLSILAAGLNCIKKNPLFAFGILWFFLFLLPSSSITPIQDVMFEHRLYLPLAGLVLSFFALFGFPDDRLIISKFNIETLYCVFFLFISLSLGYATYIRLEVWKDSISLWSDVVKKSPNKARPLNNLGFALYKQGNIEEAIQRYSEALKIQPQSPEIRKNMGLALATQGKVKEAMSHFSDAFRINPPDVSAQNKMGMALMKDGYIKEAISYFSKALQIKPDYGKARINLGIALALSGKKDEAIGHFFRALEIKPDDIDAHYNIGTILAEKERYEEAIVHLARAVKLAPDYVKARHNLELAIKENNKKRRD